MPSTTERLAAIETLLGEVHLACVGDGSPGSSLRERTTALEEWRRTEGGLKHKGIRAGSQAIFTAAVAVIVQALHLSVVGTHT